MDVVDGGPRWLLVIGLGLIAGFIFRRSRERIEARFGGYEHCPWYFRWAGIRWVLMYGWPPLVIMDYHQFRADVAVITMGLLICLGALFESGHFLVWWRIWKDMYLCLIGKGDFSRDKTSYWK